MTDENETAGQIDIYEEYLRCHARLKLATRCLQVLWALCVLSWTALVLMWMHRP